ncbi:P-loop containing nucleoside triphosphate hydrolase protein [Pleurostoma richardsiae]|uniref:P-loop containing nucleoside triphosphate hydrolase protein n=1 Tax=Pleurostoma richardsiae TaxID=41990 RepID=A0AA38S2C9_9PEZI|nr:P-loop containing nucleoside triphosphate hydrolase protein [Pleurostoma richardsiae]
MSKPIFAVTHPRACSTAFERVFMTRPDLSCLHEPFGDAFYYGPERLSERFADDEATRIKSGAADWTYKTIVDRIDSEAAEKGKRVFIKDMAYYLMPPDGKPAELAPSLREQQTNGHSNGTSHSEEGNPTVIPTDILRKFHFTFLIRHPRKAIPSYFRCTVPPLADVTGFHHFMPNEAGYVELVRLFDYLRSQGIVGSGENEQTNGAVDGQSKGSVPITVLDADDLLDDPETVIRSYCEQVGLEFTQDMLNWDDEENQKRANEAFEKWNGFHNDALKSTSLKPRNAAHTPQKSVSVEAEDEEWRKKYGEEAQKVIRECVNANIPHYEYLKSFAMKI